MKEKLLFAVIASIAVFASACSNETSTLVGKWVEPIPGMEDKVQGVSLKQDGHATSINMATLQYENWQQIGDKLILTGSSIGNGTSGSFTDTFIIEKITADELILKRGEENITLKRVQ